MVMWPLPTDKLERLRLMAHESWHRIQSDLGLPASSPSNEHLDTRDGRIWMQFEWRALAAALRNSPDGRQRAIEDALTFRAYRRSLFPKTANGERAMEMHEGLAEYTGIRLSSESAAAEQTVQSLTAAEDRGTFVWSFAYACGPAYGVLLDDASPGWRKGLTSQDDLGKLLEEALEVSLPSDLAGAARKRSVEYDAHDLVAAENKREKDRQARTEKHRKRFVHDPVLVIPLRQMSVEFNPSNLQPLDDLGTVYPTMKIADIWGILNATGGALMATNWSSVRVPAPSDLDARPLVGDGWTLELKKGWTVVPGKRRSDYTLASK
jgi:hypothetical protein